MEIVGRLYTTGDPVKMQIHGNKITNITALSKERDFRELGWIAPGLIDLQVNGYGGFDFNCFPVSAHSVIRLTQELWKIGVTQYYPTIITNSSSRCVQGIEAIVDAVNQNADVKNSILGIHLEGPYISSKVGARGAHNRTYVRDPRIDEIEDWFVKSEGLIKLLTLAPERKGAFAFIEHLTEMGMVVAIGHTTADYDTISAAVLHGAKMSTHLGNGTEIKLHRHVNYVNAQLANDELWASVIADGFHLPKDMLKIFKRVKGEKLIMVSDCTVFADLNPGAYKSDIGGDVYLDPSGRLYTKENPEILAGSALPLNKGIENMVRWGICDLCEAIQMGSIRPASLMGVKERMSFQAGSNADLILFDWNAGESVITIHKTIVGGKLVFDRKSMN